MSEPSPGRISLGKSSVRGAMWLAGGGLVAKFAAVGVQFGLGWLLDESDFSVYGTALSLTVFTSALTDGGVQRLLRQQPHRYRELIGPAVALSLLTAIAGALVLSVLAVVSPAIYHTDAVRPIALVLAANVPVTAATAFMRTRFHIDLRFRAIAARDACTVAGQGGLAVLFAWLGFGAMSFVLPLVIVNIVECVVLAMLGGAREFNLHGISRASVITIFRSSGWIMLSSFCGVLVLRGDYLAMGFVAEPMLGYYFFGFQLVASSLALITAGANGILLPTLARVVHDPPRFRAALHRSFRLAAFMLAPAGSLLALAAPAVIHLLWKGRWDPSIPVAQAIAISACIRGLGVVSGASVEASGRWRVRAALEAIDGSTLIATVLVAVQSGLELAGVAAAIAVQRCLAGTMHLGVAGLVNGVGFTGTLRWAGRFVVPSYAVLAAAEGVGRLSGLEVESVGGGLVRVGAFALGWIVVVGLLGRSEVNELRHGRPKSNPGTPVTGSP